MLDNFVQVGIERGDTIVGSSRPPAALVQTLFEIYGMLGTASLIGNFRVSVNILADAVPLSFVDKWSALIASSYWVWD